MLAVAIAYSALSLVFATPLALWGALFVAGLLGMYWFHRARTRPVFKPYLFVWIILAGALWYASSHRWCTSAPTLPVELPSLFCPFPQSDSASSLW